MPRRPRPASRRPASNSVGSPEKAKAAQPASRAKSASSSRPKPTYHEEASGSEDSAIAGSESDEFFEEGASGSGSSGSEDDEDGLEGSNFQGGDYDDAEPDAPRVAQWVDDEELDAVSEEESESSEDEETQQSRLVCPVICLSMRLIRIVYY